ncbi:MAG: hypothetical protein Q9160_002956 [Pyrenula sp. 1 TL-2023]
MTTTSLTDSSSLLSTNTAAVPSSAFVSDLGTTSTQAAISSSTISNAQSNTDVPTSSISTETSTALSSTDVLATTPVSDTSTSTSTTPPSFTDTPTPTLPVSSTTTSTPSTTPLPTNAILNPSFEIADPSSSSHTPPWSVFGSSSIQSNTNNAYQSRSGSYFAVLYGRSAQTSSLSQTFTQLTPGATYTLDFFYRYFVSSTFPQTCQLAVTWNGVTVGAVTNPRTGQAVYVESSVPDLVARGEAGEGDTLAFSNTCPRLTGATAQANLGLDDITLVQVA